MIPADILSAMRHRFGFYDFPKLTAATFEEIERHLRIDFFFDGSSEEVDYDELESGILGELVADAWSGFDTIGFAVFFDAPSAKRALTDPLRLYPALDR